jgi:tetratricopeptide (TPR) repeat protein
MKWLALLSRGRRSPNPIPTDQAAVRPLAGIDYLLAQAGRASVTNQPPVPCKSNPPDPSPMGETISWQPLHEAAEQAQEGRDWAGAEQLWRAMRVGFLDIWFSYTGGAAALLSLDRIDEASQLLFDAAARFPHEHAIRHELGHLAMRQADWPSAEAHWRAALTFSVRPWWIYTELAGSLEQQGRLIEAEAILLDGQAEDPAEISLFTYHAQLAWQRGDWAAAVARWAEARRRFPLVPELPAREYEALMRLAEHDSAAYESALNSLGQLSRDAENARLRSNLKASAGPGQAVVASSAAFSVNTAPNRWGCSGGQPCLPQA